jgi:hypothetical protein
MSRYAVDRERVAIVVSWSTGAGDVAVTVAGLSSFGEDGQALDLAYAATRLSRELWRCYTHPASASASLEPNTEGWHCQASREAFGEVLAAIQAPNLPSGGLLLQSYDPVVEWAHRVGHALHAIDDPDLTERIVADFGAELDAVERAERGDLSGRSRQAVVLSRQDASPVQVAAADQILQANPLGGESLFTDVDPTAAAVAAAHWLRAAAEVASDQSGIDATEVVRTADDIEALPHESPTLVLKALDAGATPSAVVTGLIRDAMTVAQGQIPDLAALVARARKAERQADDISAGPELRGKLIASIRATPLDPTRPALDLLEDLLSGIRGCWLVFSEYANLDEGDDDGEDSDPGAGDQVDDDGLEEEFIEFVRMAATETRDQPA